MSETLTITSATPVVLTVVGDINSAGEAVVDLTGTNTGSLQAANNLSDLDDAPTALANLGGTATGIALFTAAAASNARTAIGATATGSSLITAADAAAARTAAAAMDRALSEAAGVSVALGDYADDAAAALGGVAVGKLYRTGSILKVRVA